MNHRPRKRFGQHFLTDEAVLERMVRHIRPRSGDHFVEIGPGRGALTFRLRPDVARLDVVELDRDLVAALRRRAGGDPGWGVHEADALRFDFAGLVDERPLRVVGNLPYNISTPLVFHLLDQASAIEDLHLMLQREVVTRMTASPGGRDYGRLSVGVQYRCRAERLFDVPPEAFDPAPRVTSALVALRPRAAPPVDVGDAGRFNEIVAAAFGRRRKTLRNALKGHLSAGAIRAAGVDPRARAETLDLDAFAALSRAACE